MKKETKHRRRLIKPTEPKVIKAKVVKIEVNKILLTPAGEAEIRQILKDSGADSHSQKEAFDKIKDVLSK